MIIATDEKAAKAGAYNTTQFIEDPILVDLDERKLRSVKTDSHYCIPGTGFNSFKNDFCDNASFPSNTWWWCDPEANFFWRDRWTTNHKRKKSLGITAACSGPASTSHYYKNIWGNWKHNKTWHLPSGYWHWTKWPPPGQLSSPRDRWIRHRAILQGGNSFFRCVSFFWT